MLKTYSWWHSVIITILAIKYVNCFGAKLSMNIHQSGFHRSVLQINFFSSESKFFISSFRRTIKYITVFTDPPEKPCDFYLKQVIPSSAYVSVDQLDDLKRFDKVNFY